MKKILLILFLIPFLGQARIIPETSRENNPGIGANTLILYGYNNLNEEEQGLELQELYFILGGDIPPIFNSMIYISIAQNDDKTWKIDPTTAIVRTTNWEDITLMGGRWFIDLGGHNPYFTFQFPFIDQPVLITEIFGSSALIGIGFGMDWKLPVGWHSEFKIEFTQVDNDVFFDDKDSNWLSDARWENTIEFSESHKTTIAASYGYGEGFLNVWGADLVYTWHPTNIDRKVLEWVFEYVGKDRFPARSGFYTHLRSEVFKDWWLQYRFDYTGLEKDRILPIIRRHVALVGWVPSDKLAIRLQLDTATGKWNKREERALFQLNIGIGAFSENTY